MRKDLAGGGRWDSSTPGLVAACGEWRRRRAEPEVRLVTRERCGRVVRGRRRRRWEDWDAIAIKELRIGLPK